MTIQTLTSQEAYNLLVEALIEKGYDRSYLECRQIFRNSPKACIRLKTSRILVKFLESGDAEFQFNDYHNLEFFRDFFDGSYEGLKNVLNKALAYGCELP